MKHWFLLGWIIFILLTGLTACTGTPSSSIIVHMTITDLTIESSLTTFSKNVPYHFIITNKSTKTHEFLLGPLIQPGMTMNDVEGQKLFGVGVITVGATKSSDFTFKNLAALGVWEFSCHVGRLYEVGLRLEMAVV